VHPSYYSSDDEKLLSREILQLSKSAGEKIIFSRQHYLRFNIQKTPHLLLQNGIAADFTMGFATQPGFRAGTSHPFYYYDFQQEKGTELLFIPFCAMDGAYSVYREQEHEKMSSDLMAMASEIKKNGGYFITVFHERSFYDHLYPGFGSLYKNLHSQLVN
jgi:hypothetical protein